jgi:hypothetical protein
MPAEVKPDPAPSVAIAPPAPSSTGVADALVDATDEAAAPAPSVAPSLMPTPLTGPAPIYGAPPAPGGRTAADMSAVIAGARPRLRKCVDTVPDPVHGKVRFELEIAPNGSVAKVTPSPDSVPAPVVACGTAVMRGLKFAPDAGTTKIAVPIVYEKE